MFSNLFSSVPEPTEPWCWEGLTAESARQHRSWFYPQIPESSFSFCSHTLVRRRRRSFPEQADRPRLPGGVPDLPDFYWILAAFLRLTTSTKISENAFRKLCWRPTGLPSELKCFLRQARSESGSFVFSCSSVSINNQREQPPITSGCWLIDSLC